MKSRLVMLMSLAIAALSIVLAAGHFKYSMSGPTIAKAPLQATPASYLGVFEPGAPPNYRPIANFGNAAGREPNMAGYFSGWAEPFNTAFAETLHRHGVIPYVQIDPTDASVSAIAAGDDDSYLETYADAVADYGHAVVIGFGHEMNAPWYSWGYGHVPASTFVAAWRHLVTVFRQEGADNVTWLWTIQADVPGTGPITSWWPGGQYVTWVGIDGFYVRPSDTFDSVFGGTIAQVRAFTNKPVLLSETAVGPGAGQFSQILDLFRGVLADKILGLVWFDFPQDNGTYQQDWRIEGTTTAQVPFKLGVSEDLTPAGNTKA
jgi:hypothetical protein